MPDSIPAARPFTVDELALRAALAAEVRDALTAAGWVASGSSYYDGVNDALMVFRGADPTALKLANVAKRKERLGW